MIKAAIITWPNIMLSNLVISMKKLAYEFDIDLQEVPLAPKTGGKEHYSLISKFEHVVSWANHGKPFEQQNKERNILHFENGLLTRGETFYLDDNGYGSSSNIVLRKYNTQKYSDTVKSNLITLLVDAGFLFECPLEKTNTILVGLQGKFNDNRLLQNCVKFLPQDANVLVRPHPGLYDKCCEIFNENCSQHQNYKLDTEKDPFQSLLRCDALIVNNSSLMYKAMCMNKKVATCDKGFHTNSTAVLDCTTNPQLLSKIYDFQPDFDATLNLLCGIQSQAVSRNATISDLLNNPNFANWLIRTRKKR
jgi:hypothetical protein